MNHLIMRRFSQAAVTTILVASAVGSLTGCRRLAAKFSETETQWTQAAPRTSGTTPQPACPVNLKSVAPGQLTAQFITYESRTLRTPRTYGLILPPGYDQRPQQCYPVVVLLHGGHGDAHTWHEKERGDLLKTLQTLYQQDKLPPSIIVTPDGNDVRGSSGQWDPQYIDGPNGAVASYLGDELVQTLRQQYRTAPGPKFWAIGGLSSGAWGALNIGMKFPQHYGVLFSHSGYFVDQSGPQNSPLQIVQGMRAADRQSLRIYLDLGNEDEKYLAQAQEFQTKLENLNVPHQLRVFPGSHTWRYWRTHLPDSLTYVGQQFRQP
jgi:enterochelin esterase-like enzyme